MDFVFLKRVLLILYCMCYICWLSAWIGFDRKPCSSMRAGVRTALDSMCTKCDTCRRPNGSVLQLQVTQYDSQQWGEKGAWIQLDVYSRVSPSHQYIKYCTHCTLYDIRGDPPAPLFSYISVGWSCQDMPEPYLAAPRSLEMPAGEQTLSQSVSKPRWIIYCKPRWGSCRE